MIDLSGFGDRNQPDSLIVFTGMRSWMNKKEWQDVVSKKTGHSPEIVEEILETALEEIYQSMKRQEKVTLVHFGTFYIDDRRNGTMFKFNPSQKWRAMLGWSSTFKGEI